MFPEYFQFHNPTRVIFGKGISSNFSPELDIIGKSKYFIISDKIINDLGIVDTVIDGLKTEGIGISGVFLDIPQDAGLNAVKKCINEINSSDAEGIIAIGGGSVLDAAKVVNIVFTHGGDLVEDYSGAYTITSGLKPLIAIPTTAGTGSEVTMAAVVHDEENNEKIAFVDKYILPDMAILDPELTQTLPPSLTASTGMDALSHAIESFVDNECAPLTDMFTCGAVELIFNNIEKAVDNGNDIDVRSAMMIASCVAGICISHSQTGCVHGIAHNLGALYRVPHGEAIAIMLPHGMEYNLNHVSSKFARLARYMGVKTDGLNEKEAACEAINAVHSLVKRLHERGVLPLRLRDVHVPRDGLMRVAEGAVSDGTSLYNPREIEPEELVKHLENAY
ncbi:MAG: iron-containing alcohol dehydrogenase [Spirochaetota bacterium]